MPRSEPPSRSERSAAPLTVATIAAHCTPDRSSLRNSIPMSAAKMGDVCITGMVPRDLLKEEHPDKHLAAQTKQRAREQAPADRAQRRPVRHADRGQHDDPRCRLRYPDEQGQRQGRTGVAVDYRLVDDADEGPDGSRQQRDDEPGHYLRFPIAVALRRAGTIAFCAILVDSSQPVAPSKASTGAKAAPYPCAVVRGGAWIPVSTHEHDGGGRRRGRSSAAGHGFPCLRTSMTEGDGVVGGRPRRGRGFPCLRTSMTEGVRRRRRLSARWGRGFPCLRTRMTEGGTASCAVVRGGGVDSRVCARG